MTAQGLRALETLSKMDLKALTGKEKDYTGNFDSTSSKIIQAARQASKPNENPMGNPDYLFTPFAYGEETDELRRFKKEQGTSGGGTFNYSRMGISIWPKLDKRPSSTVANEQIEKMLLPDEVVQQMKKLKLPKKDKKEQKIEKRNMDNSTEFLFAVIEGEVEKVRKLVKYDGIDMNITFEKVQAYGINNGILSVTHDIDKMHRIVSHNIKKTLASVELPDNVKEALETNVNSAQSATSYSPTPLFWAITFHRHEVLKILLKHPGININQIDATIHATALHEAVFVKNHKAVRMLLAKKRFTVVNKVSTSWDLLGETGLSALMGALSYTRTDSCNNYVKCAKYIIKRARKLNLETKYCGRSAMEMVKNCNTCYADEYLRLLDQRRKCWNCEKQDRVRVCRGCKRALYCGEKCQTTDWDRHRRYCLKHVRNRRASKGRPKKPRKAKKTTVDDQQPTEPTFFLKSPGVLGTIAGGAWELSDGSSTVTMGYSSTMPVVNGTSRIDISSTQSQTFTKLSKRLQDIALE